VSRVALLDVNVLVALFDPDHVHHDAAHDWFADLKADGWATCPLTENGLLRVLSNPAYSPTAERPAVLRRSLRLLCESGHHVFWPDDVSLLDSRRFEARLPIASRQTTDVYLLGLALAHGGCVATFDRSIPFRAVTGATSDDLLVIAV
jgi:toxin-antitoxin system PIN domain toxin